jgi:hypothetical protein
MTVLDPSTALGKVRLKIGDWHDLVILPDAVIESALADCNQSVSRASQTCAQYILATLTSKTHKKLATMEAWSGEQFTNYLQYLKLTVLNPNFSDIAPIPYSGDPTIGAAGSGTSATPIQDFVREWKQGYIPGTFVIGPCGVPEMIVNDNPS